MAECLWYFLLGWVAPSDFTYTASHRSLGISQLADVMGEELLGLSET